MEKPAGGIQRALRSKADARRRLTGSEPNFGYAAAIAGSVLKRAAASPFSFSFDFSNGPSYRSDDLLFQGDAGLHDGLVDLTCNSLTHSIGGCKGRMSYNHPVPFYDNTTGVVASFSTRFHFAIRIVNTNGGAGDGMAFFLSSYPSVLPESGGETLALHDGDGMNAVGTNRIIAVEFDTFQNLFDPNSSHIGIDINTVKASVNTTSLNGSMNDSMTAFITFNSSTRMLVASLQFDDNPSRGPYQVSAQLTDPVTDLLPSEVAVGFSAATGAEVELHQILSWSFNSTLHARKDNRKLVIGGAVVCVVILVVSLLVWFILSWFRWRRIRDSFSAGTNGLKRFRYSDLAGATGRFCKQNVLGEGAFGAVYKGSYTDENGKQEVAVKKIKKTTCEAGDFISELKTISATRHMNLIELKGWCCSRNIYSLTDFLCWCRQPRVKLYLVYELVHNGNLDDHLHHTENILPWEKRYQIVKGIGSGLRYLHHQCKDHILHRDIKPSNILLDYHFNAKLADFGLSRATSENNTTLVTIAIGTEGYMDPQCRKHGKVQFSRKSDVYSFGIVLLEIACTDKSREQVWELYRDSSTELDVVKAAADGNLGGVFDETQMARVILLGLKCSHPDGKRRPYMEDAMKFLEDGIELPATTEIESQQGERFLGTISSDEYALLSPQLRS
ncbi:hypothetical protein ACQ4PT_020284 [Festuca glaucescens]